MFFLSKKRQKETFFHILDRKECFLDNKRKVAKNAKKSTFCKGVSPWFFSKTRPFSNMFPLSKKSHKETFFNILDRKESFLNLKSEVLAKSKKSTFCKGVSRWFLSKYRPFFICFFFEQNKKETFFMFLIEKNTF